MNSTKNLEWKYLGEQYHFCALVADVDMAKQVIEKKPRKIGEIDVSSLANLVSRPVVNPNGSMTMKLGHCIDWNMIDNGEIDLNFPIITILMQNDDGNMSPWPIDGWHRIAKSIEQGITKVPFVQLTEAESKKVSNLPRRRRKVS